MPFCASLAILVCFLDHYIIARDCRCFNGLLCGLLQSQANYISWALFWKMIVFWGCVWWNITYHWLVTHGFSFFMTAFYVPCAVFFFSRTFPFLLSFWLLWMVKWFAILFTAIIGLMPLSQFHCSLVAVGCFYCSIYILHVASLFFFAIFMCWCSWTALFMGIIIFVWWLCFTAITSTLS